MTSCLWVAGIIIILALLSVSNFLLHLFLGPFSRYMTAKEAWPNYITLAIAFRDGHPIKCYFDDNTQNLITAVAMLSIDEHFRDKSDEGKLKWMEDFKRNKNCFARWFWNLK
ncbi:MAG: hypothetical protein AGIKBDMD_00534 [Synergistaceae bacterium]